MTMVPTTLAQRERHALCDLLAELGPDAPTLCEGWRSADLAAHLYVREHRPDAAPGMVLTVAPLAKWSRKVQQDARHTLGWDDLVSRVRSGPPPALRRADPAFNTVEFFVHHEDLRRARPGWQPRALSPEDEAELWRRARVIGVQAKLARALHGPEAGASQFEATDLPPIVVSRGRGPVISGRAGEVVLWALGRRDVAQVSRRG